MRIRPAGRLPIPRHPAARLNKPKFEATTKSPKRVFCLGVFFVAGGLIPRQIAKQARGHGKLRQGEAGIGDLVDGAANPLDLGLARGDPGFDRASPGGTACHHCSRQPAFSVADRIARPVERQPVEIIGYRDIVAAPAMRSSWKKAPAAKYVAATSATFLPVRSATSTISGAAPSGPRLAIKPASSSGTPASCNSCRRAARAASRRRTMRGRARRRLRRCRRGSASPRRRAPWSNPRCAGTR